MSFLAVRILHTTRSQHLSASHSLLFVNCLMLYVKRNVMWNDNTYLGGKEIKKFLLALSFWRKKQSPSHSGNNSRQLLQKSTIHKKQSLSHSGNNFRQLLQQSTIYTLKTSQLTSNFIEILWQAKSN